MPVLNSDELALLRSLASRGDKVAEILMRSFDTIRAADKEVVVVKAATTANRTLSGLTNTVLDGVTPAAGDLILVKSQTDAKTNGIYKAASGTWTRVTDDQGDYLLMPGMVVNVRSGDTLAGTMWTCDAAATVVGTNDITFAEFTGAVAAAGIGAAIFGTPTFVLGGEVAHARTVTIQLKDIHNVNLGAKAMATVWISATAAGAVTGTPPDGGTTVNTGTAIRVSSPPDILLDVLSDASGVIVLELTESTEKSFYVNVAVGATVASSAAVAFAG